MVPTFLAKHMCAFNDGTYETMKHIDKLVNARGLLRFSWNFILWENNTRNYNYTIISMCKKKTKRGQAIYSYRVVPQFVRELGFELTTSAN